MSDQAITEMLRIREELIPAADELRAASRAVPSERGFAEQTRADVKKIRSHAKEFRQDVGRFFPKNPEAPAGSTGHDLLRKSRHDARNRLNHLFNLVQLLGISEDYAAMEVALSKLSSHLDRCLAILSATIPEEPETGSSTAAAAEPVEVAITSDGPVVETFAPHPHPGDILIADDDAENRELLARLLEPAGHTLYFAKDGAEAIEMIDKKVYDAVLLDIQMPKMDGFEVLSRLHDSGHLRMTPVIVVTGLQEEQDAVRCIEIGAEDFLSRPIRPALLMARLNASLEKKRLREQVLEQHFTPELARELARNPNPMAMEARVENVSLLFCDIRKFSTISERLGPAQTVDWLSSVMGEFSSIVIDLGGVLVDYTGDELLAMWGAPSHQPNHAELACEAALAIMESLKGINEEWAEKVGAQTRVGVGVNTGRALVGNIGTHRKFKYGPLGTCVNLASRVQGATKYLSTPLLITSNTAAELSDSFLRRRLCAVRVQNIHEPVDLYELAPRDVSRAWKTQSPQYEEALDLFEFGKIPESLKTLSQLDVLDDQPSVILMGRILELMKPDAPEFNPIWELPGK